MPDDATSESTAVFVGTRPEAIKLAPVVRELERVGRPVEVVLTGQHRELLAPVLEELELRPRENLDVLHAGQPLSELAARVLRSAHEYLERRRPARLVVQGDTSSALAAALAAFHLGVPVAHVEAGLRTHAPRNPFPEEMNRRLIGALADLHFAPTPAARENLLREGVGDARIHVVGNTVIDALVRARDELVPARAPDPRLDALPREGRELLLVTTHRRESLDGDMARVLDGVARLARDFADAVDVVLPVHRHPAVRDVVGRSLGGIANVHLVEPLGYVAFVALMLRARLIVTDSGGVQEEAAFLGVPTLVARRTSERAEAVEAGVATRLDCDGDRVRAEAAALLSDDAAHRARARPTTVFGDGTAARRIVAVLAGRPA